MAKSGKVTKFQGSLQGKVPPNYYVKFPQNQNLQFSDIVKKGDTT